MKKLKKRFKNWMVLLWKDVRLLWINQNQNQKAKEELLTTTVQAVGVITVVETHVVAEATVVETAVVELEEDTNLQS